jgi:hypothetical protein
MASSYSTDLKLELMVTGENAGTWGDKTNTNLNLVQQAVAGYQAIDVASSDVALVMTDGTISNARNAVLKLTGTLAANRNVTVPNGIEKIYTVVDGTNHDGNTLTFKTASGTGVLLCEGNTYSLFADAKNVVKASEQRNWRVVSAAETVQAGAQLLCNTNGGSFTITLPASPSTGDEVSFMDQGYDFDSNALTVGRNGSNIANVAGDLVVSTQGAGFSLVYSGDATTGWGYREK